MVKTFQGINSNHKRFEKKSANFKEKYTIMRAIDHCNDYCTTSARKYYNTYCRLKFSHLLQEAVLEINPP